MERILGTKQKYFGEEDYGKRKKTFARKDTLNNPYFRDDVVDRNWNQILDENGNIKKYYFGEDTRERHPIIDRYLKQFELDILEKRDGLFTKWNYNKTEKYEDTINVIEDFIKFIGNTDYVDDNLVIETGDIFFISFRADNLKRIAKTLPSLFRGEIKNLERLKYVFEKFKMDNNELLYFYLKYKDGKIIEFKIISNDYCIYKNGDLLYFVNSVFELYKIAYDQYNIYNFFDKNDLEKFLDENEEFADDYDVSKIVSDTFKIIYSKIKI